jgi:hypothetical protein
MRIKSIKVDNFKSLQTDYLIIGSGLSALKIVAPPINSIELLKHPSEVWSNVWNLNITLQDVSGCICHASRPSNGTFSRSNSYRNETFF